ncbi:sulfate transporter family-domain-containing protein [Fennellomyces sp. T-0311]|nr:sulfate transporter family-domain-containing protein [Fennellomyces sp. T-0311]
MSTVAYIDNPPPEYVERTKYHARLIPQHIRSYFSGMLPIISWLPHYNVKWLSGDFLCGITIGAVIIPQAMAYAKLAGLPPQYGLYASFVGVAIYPFLGSSKDISMGTSAIQSIFISQVFLGVQGTPQYQSGVWNDHLFAVNMALFSGIIAFGLSVFRLGILSNFLSQPAISGFMAGSAVTIVISQFAHIFGVEHIKTTEAPYLVFWKTLINLNHSTIDAVVGILSLVWLFGVKYSCLHYAKKYPRHAGKIIYFNTSRNIIVLVVTTFMAWAIKHFGHHEESPLQILGPVPSGFQLLGVPKVDVSLVGTILPSLPSMVTLLVLEHYAIASSLGKTSDYKVDINQELLAIGIANMFGSFFGAYPATGCFSRSAVTNKSGARTPMTSMFVCVIVILALYALTPAFQFIPSSSLAAVIAHAVVDLIVGPKTWLRYWRAHPSELLVFGSSYIIALFARIDISVFVPVGLSIVIQLYRTARPAYSILGRVDTHPPHLNGKKQERSDYDELANCRFFSFTHPTVGHCVRPIAPGIIAFQPRDNLVFENAAFLTEKLLDEVKRTTRRGTPLAEKAGDRPWNDCTSFEKARDKPLLRAIILDLTAVNQMDYTGLENLMAVTMQVERYSGKPLSWYIVPNDSLSVRKCLLLGGFGNQERKIGGPFRSDLNRKKQDSRDTDQTSIENDKKGVIAIEDVEKYHGTASNGTGPYSNIISCGKVDYDTVANFDDVYPYFFLTLRDAALAAYVSHAVKDDDDAPESSPEIASLNVCRIYAID